MKKGYKVTDGKRRRKIGVACSSLEELRSKGCMKLDISLKCRDKVVIQLEDGTVVDDEAYFSTLPQNSLFLLLLPGENAVTGAEIIYNALKAINLEYLQAGELASIFFTEHMKEKVQQLASLISYPKDTESAKALDVKRSKSNRNEDPDWFQDLDTNANTKEQFLFKRSQDRIRGYFYKSNEDLRKSVLYKEDRKAREKIDDVVQNIRKHLAHCEYFGSYFDRKAKPDTSRLCNEDGDFRCRGSWQATCCLYRTHTINPYDSREARILFSTWNLDHRAFPQYCASHVGSSKGSCAQSVPCQLGVLLQFALHYQKFKACSYYLPR